MIKGVKAFLITAAQPEQTHKEQQPDNCPHSHGAKTVDRHGTARVVKQPDGGKDKQVQRKNNRSPVFPIMNVAPRDNAHADINKAHHRVVDEQRQKDNVARIGADQDATARKNCYHTKKHRDKRQDFAG